MFLDNAREKFYNYVKEYDLKNYMIQFKYDHSLRVSDLCKRIARSLNLSDEDIKLATLIGLLHDVARFEQDKKFNSLIDAKTFDHGAFAINILFENGFIREFVSDETHHEIIKKSIFCHNKKTIPDNYGSREKLFSEILRDADKIDILYTVSVGYDTKFGDTWTPELVELVNNKMPVDVKMVKGRIDGTILRLGLVYDINFVESLKILREKNYINLIKNNIKGQKKVVEELFKDVIQKVNNYIEERIGEIE